MSLRNSVLLPSTVTKTLVCIDTMEHYEFAGKILNPYMQKIYSFKGVKEFLDIMDNFFDEIGFPQPYYSERTFDDTKTFASYSRKDAVEINSCWVENNFEEYSGDIVTFILNVKFRQNASWQGNIEWREKKISNNFRSSLELIKLIDSAIENVYTGYLKMGWDL